MIAKQIAGLVERRIRQIQGLPEHPRRAALANLRRGIGRAPGELPELWGSFLQEMPPEFFSRNGNPTAAEWAIYLALTLFALHQQSQEKSMCADGAGIGKAVRQLANKQREDPQDSGAFKRFSALLTSDSVEEVSHHLRGLIQLLRGEGLPLDYPQLAVDLFELQFPDSAPQVKLRWGQDYFYQPNETQEPQEKEDSHELQTVPPSCVNRDDTGSPKTAVYGGVRRARVSSQAWKRAMRTMFREELLNPEQMGERTKKVLQILAEEIQRIAPEQEAEKLAKKAMEYAGLTPSKKNGNDLDALFFLSHFQAKALASLIVEGSSDKKAYHDALEKAPSMDMALFGRMVASDPSLNYDASAQVAHSISTHRVQNEYDYFTAVDDCAPEDNAGAGHLGTVEYNSSTLYRYATVNLLELAGYLGKEDAVKAVEVFAEAFIRSMPTGKQNTFANRTLPDVVYITLRDDQPVNLCGAFEQAVPSTANGYVEASKQRFVSYTEQVYADYTGKPQIAFTVGKGWESLAAPLPLRAMLAELSKAVSQQLRPCEVS